MFNFDIFNAPVSTVAKGLGGKVITLVGSNNLGKTKQATRMEKPFHLSFEKGLRAIPGIPYASINKWADFKIVNGQLTNPMNLEKLKEQYQTIIFDEVYTAAMYCQDYLCKQNGVKTIGDGNNGYGLWKEYEKEFWTEIDLLLGAGFTLVFIMHDDVDKDTGQRIPKGDKRSVKPIIDNSDLVLYLTPNSYMGEDGKVVKEMSTAWTVETPQFFARSRFDFLATHIHPFTAENLESAVAEAVRLEEENSGIEAVTFEEQLASSKTETADFETLMATVKTVGNELVDLGKTTELLALIEKHFGPGVMVDDIEPRQADTLLVLVSDVQELRKSLEPSAE